MRPHAGIVPLGHTPGTRPRRERSEVSITVPFHDEASVLAHCLERLQRIGEQWGRRAVDALQRLPERNRDTKGRLPRSAWSAK